LSIITVNKNNADGLEKTCQSVAWQNFENFEWIIIDGASNDNSVDIIKKYAYKMAHWISEPDTGIYNAMNKGIKLAKGDYCLFLNSGDWLLSSDSIKAAFNIIKNLDYADIYYGDCLNSDFTISKMPDRLSIDHLYTQSALSHQNTFINRSLFYDHEFYDENFPTVSDSIFFAKELWMYRSKFVHIKTIISVYNVGGMSSVYKYAQEELHGQIKNIMGFSNFFFFNMRIKFKKIIIKNIKYLLPYGIVRYFQLRLFR
jgi:glycosyltransferase involved in cell wall biosynthesis